MAKERLPTSSDGFTGWYDYCPEPIHKGKIPSNTPIWKKLGAGVSIAELPLEFKLMLVSDP